MEILSGDALKQIAKEQDNISRKLQDNFGKQIEEVRKKKEEERKSSPPDN